MTTDFDGRVVVITGAASGMGRATAIEFARRGAMVGLIDRNADGLEDIATDIGGSAHEGDVTDSAFCAAAVDALAGQHGRVDVLVNAAGVIHRAGALGTTDDDWRRVMSVNVDGIFFMCRAAIPHMIRSDGGAIVNFGSISGTVGSAGGLAYCTSKGAVHQLTRAMAMDHVEQGIRVNAVAPGEVNTPMLRSERDEPMTADDLQALADATIPMKRLAEPEEIARVVAFLASDDASYMTGEIVHVDAGYTAR
ncbi:MAG: SDR family NAD(P)-dependent oxidoreductase [Acidimicrobiales bacterium]